MNELARALAARAETERIAAELATKRWTRSEINGLIRELHDAGNVTALRELYDAVQAAESTGRVTEDTAGTKAAAAALPPGTWRMSTSEMNALMKWADTQPDDMRTAAYHAARELAASGRVYDDGADGFGTLYAQAVPDWAYRTLAANYQLAPDNAHALEAAALQKQRFAAMESNWRLMLERRAAGAEPHAWQPGMGWEPIDEQSYIGKQFEHRRASKQAAAVVTEVRAEQARAELAAAREAARKGLTTEQRTALDAAS